MPNLDANECYEFLKQHYSESHDCEAIILDLCNCFDSNVITEFVEYLNQEYEDANEES